MIEINLLPGRKKKKKGAGRGISLPDLSELGSKVKDPLLLGAVGLALVVLPLMSFFFLTERSGLVQLQDERDAVQAQARRFQNLMREKRRQEALRDSLVVELEAIREIDSDRYVWAHVMEEVSKALPDFTWLVSLEFVPAPAPDLAAGGTEDAIDAPVRFAVSGRTADIGAYTRFLRNLATSPWISDVDPGRTETVQEGERPLTAFTIVGTFASADSAFIRTAPLAEALR